MKTKLNPNAEIGFTEGNQENEGKGLPARGLVAAVMALGLGCPNSAEAAINFFTDRVAWQSAAGAASFTENFSAFPADTPFQTSACAQQRTDKENHAFAA